MIWNNKILFIHVPKTAGMSMTSMLTQNLLGRLFVTGPFENSTTQDIVYIEGKRHETLVDAESVLTYRNKSIFDFEKIFCVMRNPYELELSRYTYLQKNYPGDRGPAQRIALESDFKTYLKTAPFFGMNPPRIHLYYTFNGQIPDNLVILRHEKLNEDIETYLKDYLKLGYELPFDNVTKHKKYKDVYDAEMEQLCFLRHKWFFEKNFYPRESF
ncbi:MAG: hypothetical protein AAGE59_09500 [Cyanobacteria bacterium P01_F01_bin.86]